MALRIGIVIWALVMAGAAPQHTQAQSASPITIETARQITRLGGLQIPGATHIEWSPDPTGRLLAVASVNGVALYTVADVLAGSATPFLLQDDGRPAQDLAFSADGALLAVAGGTVVRIYDVASGSELFALQGTAPIDFSPQGTELLYTTANDVRIYDLALGGERGALTGHTDRINDTVFSLDGGLIASASQDTTLRYWSAARSEQIGFSRSRRNPITALDISPNGALIASGTRSGVIRLLNLAVDIERSYRPPGVRDTIMSIDFSADGSLLLFSVGTSVHLIDPGARTEVLVLTDHSAAVQQAQFNPDGSMFATIGLDGALFLYGL